VFGGRVKRIESVRRNEVDAIETIEIVDNDSSVENSVPAPQCFEHIRHVTMMELESQLKLWLAQFPSDSLLADDHISTLIEYGEWLIDKRKVDEVGTLLSVCLVC
jgi:hypothetical protein